MEDEGSGKLIREVTTLGHRYLLTPTLKLVADRA